MINWVARVFLLVALVGGCAATGEAPGGSTVSAEISRHVPEDDTAEGVYRVLLGELAMRQGDFETAMTQYLQLMEDNDDPEVAERAAQIALYNQSYPDVVRSARRWLELSPDSAQAQSSLAIGLAQTGESEEAAAILTDWLGDEPDDPAAFGRVRQVIQQVPDKDRAFDVIERLYHAHPDSALLSLATAQAAATLERRQLALEAAGRALRLRPGWAQAQALQARLLADEGESQQALEILLQAVERNPDNALLRLSLLQQLIDMDRSSQAREQLDDAAALATGDAGLFYSLGLMALQLDEHERAEQYFRKSLGSERHRSSAAFELGRLAELRKEYDEALAWYGQVSTGQRLMDARVRMGYVLALQNKMDAFNRLFDTLRAQDPELAVGLYIAQSEALRDLHRYRQAHDLLSRALEDYPANNELQYARALVAERLGELDRLESDLREILERDPENAQALNALGYTLADRTDRYQEAYELIARALEKLPDDAAVLDSMGWVLYRLDRSEEALTYLQRAYDLHQDQEIAAHLGEVLWTLGRRDRARAIWQEALDQDPEAPVVRETLKRFGVEPDPAQPGTGLGVNVQGV